MPVVGMGLHSELFLNYFQFRISKAGRLQPGAERSAPDCEGRINTRKEHQHSPRTHNLISVSGKSLYSMFWMMGFLSPASRSHFTTAW